MALFLVVINIKESNSKNCLFVETYLGNGRINMRNQYSGPLLMCDPFEFNINAEGKKNFGMFIVDQNLKYKKNKYIISEKNLIRFFELTEELFIFYRDDNNKLVRITEAKDQKINFEIKQKNDKSEMYFSLANDLISNKQIIITRDYLIGLSKGILFYTKVGIDNHTLHLFAENGFKLINNISNCNEVDYINTVNDITPVPVIYLLNVNKSLNAKVCFKYEIYECDFNDSSEGVGSSTKRILRNKFAEESFVNDFVKLGWSKHEEVYLYNGQDIVLDLKTLLTEYNELIILDRNHNTVSMGGGYSVNYNSQQDWFDISMAGISYSDDNIEYMLKQLKAGRNWLELNNKLILLTKKEKEIGRMISFKDNQPILHKKFVGELYELSNNNSSYGMEIFNKVTDYSKIEISDDNIVLKYLRPYQIEGVRWLLYLYINQFGGCLADDMGLGKSIQILSFLYELSLKTKGRYLLIVPKTLLYNWKNEISKFCENMQYIYYHGVGRNFDINSFGLIITTYGTVLNDIRVLNSVNYECVIMDEYQLIKNCTSKTYKAILTLRTPCKIALTGTPIENNIGEVWSMMNMLNQGVWESKKVFLKKYCNNISAINKKVSPFILRRLKADVLSELPDKSVYNVYCEMDSKQKELYDTMLLAIKKDIESEASRYVVKDSSAVLAGLLYLREICCHPFLLPKSKNFNQCNESAKYEQFKNIVEQIYNAGNKIIVFSQFTKMLDIMRKWLEKRKIAYSYLDGSTVDRKNEVEKFDAMEKGVFLISLKAGGVGLNLVSAQYALIYDPWWNPAVENQAEDRIYRIGQTSNVTIYRLITRETIEEKIENLKQEKRMISNELLSEQNEVSSIQQAILKDFL